MADPNMTVEWLFLKREAYRHEHEVRVIVVNEDQSGESSELAVAADLSDLITEVTFDPRANEWAARQTEAKNQGYLGPFGESDLRQRHAIVVPVD